MQPETFHYQLPPQEIVELLDTPGAPWLFLAPDASGWLEVEHPPLPSLAEVAQPFVRLAGMRIDPATNAQRQLAFGTTLAFVQRASLARREYALPAGRRIASVRWSHRSQSFALALVGGAGTELWVGEPGAGELRRLASGLNAIFGEGFEWMPDGESLLLTLVPRARGAAPIAPSSAEGPLVQEAHGEVTPLRTYQDLLESPHDDALFEHYATSELALVSSAGGEPRRFGAPALYASTDVATGSGFVLIQRVLRPFSRSQPVHGFPYQLDVLDLEGRLVRRVADFPELANVPVEGVRTGPRGVQWSPHEPATLLWVEALDDGDPRKTVPARDRWMRLDAPFTGEAREFLRLEQRAAALSWLPEPARVIARQYDRDRRWMRTSLHERESGAELALLDDRGVKDRYGDPGGLLTRMQRSGRRLVRIEDGFVFRAGEGQEEQGQRPFLARERLGERETTREELWRCASDTYESVVALLEGEERGRFVTRRESSREPPNLFERLLGTQDARRLTDFGDPTPLLRRVEQRLLRYTRADGVALSGKLYLPPDWKAGTRLPLVVWAYPQDYPDEGTAGQTSGTPHHFTRVGGPSQLFFALAGYAVLDDAALPIVGHPETMNDTFVEQSVSSVRAAIEYLDEEGIADPARVGVGGHSYGAYMTAMLLAHCDLFRAGIARSGAYNRSLTPFGFQAERRTLWEAPESYRKLSPFFDASRIKVPLLLIHGAEDQNPGTLPMQSERLFQALKGTGGRARFVTLPHEGHAYRARESVLHVVWEMLRWFDEHVKHGTPAEIRTRA
ncbi:MAG: S9 family peptidase [Planctomycetes bacterium]|nr:S9 family peptidase [Planctomycetota bacterium]